MQLFCWEFDLKTITLQFFTIRHEGLTNVQCCLLELIFKAIKFVMYYLLFIIY